MADLSAIKLPNNVVYSFKDETAREQADLARVKIVSVSFTSSWSGSGPYTQSITISEATSDSMIDLQPDATVLAQLISDGVAAMYVANNNGVLTAYAVGGAPTTSLTMQATITEVVSATASVAIVGEAIVGEALVG